MSRTCVYDKTEDGALRKYLKATGQGAAVVRPGSISEFVVLHYQDWLRPRVQPDTFNRYNQDWIKIGRHVGHLLFAELTPEIVEHTIRSAGTAARTQAHAKFVIKQIIGLAVAHGMATERELTMARLAKHRKIVVVVRVDVADRAEQLLANIVAAGHWSEGAVWATKTLGFRKGELCGMRVTDLGDNNVLKLSYQRSHRAGDRQRLKRREPGQVRRIALPKDLADRLRSYASSNSIYFFTDDQGKPISYQHLDRAIEPFQPQERLTIHDLRSAAVSSLVDLGVDDHTIMDIVGQVGRETLAIYRDHRDARIASALSRITSTAKTL